MVEVRNTNTCDGICPSSQLNTSCKIVVLIHGGSTAHLTNVRAVLGGNKSRS